MTIPVKSGLTLLTFICVAVLLLPHIVGSDIGEKGEIPDATIYSGEIAFPYASLSDADALMSYRANNGYRNMVPLAFILIELGETALKDGRKDDAFKYFMNASNVSPDLPEPYIHMAKSHLKFSPDAIKSSLAYLFSAWNAMSGNIWWSFRIAGIFLSSLYLALYLSIMALVAIWTSSSFKLYLHDVMEDAKKIFLILPAIVLLVLGPIFSLIALCSLFWVYLKDKEKGLLYGIIIAVFAVIISLPYHTAFLNAYADRNLREIVNVNGGYYSYNELNGLSGHDDYESVFSHALSLKRKREFHGAIYLYESLLGRGKDAVIYNNIANCYVGLSDLKTAMEYYEKSLKLSQRASSLYNLSQINREMFNFKKAAKYYADAVQISVDDVAKFASLRGDSPTSSVADEVIDQNALRHLIFKRSLSSAVVGRAGKLISYHSRGLSIILIVSLAVFLTIYGMKVQGSAYRCLKCGRIYCTICEDQTTQRDLCHRCHITESEMFQLKPKERMTRTIEMRRYRNARLRRFKILTLLLPGSGHIYFGKTFTGFMMIFIFFLLLVTLLLWTFFVPADSMEVLASSLRSISIAGIFFMYVIASIMVVREKI